MQFSLRPPLAAAAVVAMIISAAIHFMGGAQAWQPWADGLANRYYDVEGGSASNTAALVDADRVGSSSDVGRDEAEALFTDVLRFRAHMSGRIPTAEPSRPAQSPRQAPAQAPRRSSEPSASSS